MMNGKHFGVARATSTPIARAWQQASDAFARHPFLIKTVSSAAGFAFGDVLMQLGTKRRPQRIDSRRSAGMAAAGGLVGGPVGYGFIMLMEAVQPSHSKLALAAKVTLDQVLGFVIWHAALAAIYPPHRATMRRWREVVGKCVAGHYKPCLLFFQSV